MPRNFQLFDQPKMIILWKGADLIDLEPVAACMNKGEERAEVISLT